MINRFENIKSLASQINDKQSHVSKKLEELDLELKKDLDGITIYACGDSIQIEMIAEDEWRYGYLFFDDDGLKIASRTTFDDFDDSMNGVPDEYKTYQKIKLAGAKASWKLRFSDEKIINSLLNNIERNLKIALSEVELSSTAIEQVLLSEAHAIDQSVEEILVDNKPLLRDWVKARASISSDPSDSITRSSSYLESVCRYIIEDSGNSLPDKKVITNLVGAAIDCLNLDDYKESKADINQLLGGIKSICSGAGATRTHVGTAHGGSPGDSKPSIELALLINNCAATASSFLLRKYKANLRVSTSNPNKV